MTRKVKVAERQWALAVEAWPAGLVIVERSGADVPPEVQVKPLRVLENGPGKFPPPESRGASAVPEDQSV